MNTTIGEKDIMNQLTLPALKVAFTIVNQHRPCVARWAMIFTLGSVLAALLWLASLFSLESPVQAMAASTLPSGDSVAVMTQASSEVQASLFMPPEPDVMPGAPQAPTECDVDDRVASIDPRVGRLAYGTVNGATTSPFCTAWLIGNGAVLTAGHCVDCDSKDSNKRCQPVNGSDWAGESLVVEFNVPNSLPDGTTQPGPANDRYPVLVDTVNYLFPSGDAGVGRDWAIFMIDPSPNTGVTAHAQRGFFRITNRNPNSGDDIRVTGYGTDGGVANKTQQTAIGSYEGEYDNDGALYHEYTTYISPGTSGGPAIWEGNGFAIGINTHGGCDQFLGFGPGNKSTSFDTPDLGPAINYFFSPNPIHVDTAVHPGDPNGWIFNPFNNVQQAVNNAPLDARISIAAGTYQGPVVINKSMTLVAPVGNVVIDPQ